MKTSYFHGKDGFVWWNGVVENRKDPLFLGRCKVRILGWHTEDKATLPTSHLPWAQVMMPVTSASQTGVGEAPVGPVEGTWVMGFYRDGELAQEPVIMGTMHGIPADYAKQNIGFNDPRLDSRNFNPHKVLATGEVVKGKGAGMNLEAFPFEPYNVKTLAGEEADVINYTDEQRQELNGKSLYPRWQNKPTTSIYARGVKDQSSQVDKISIVTGKTNILSSKTAKLRATFQPSDRIIKTSKAITESFEPKPRYLDPEEYSTNVEENIDFPIVEYAAEYPFNHVYESESGHLIETDDTPGAERLHWYHRSGTFTEFTSRGSRLENTQGHHFNSLSGNLEEIISGSEKRSIGNDSFSSYTKNKYQDIGNDYVVVAKGNLLLGSEVGYATIKGKDIVFDSARTLYMDAKTIVRSAGSSKDEFKGTYTINALGAYDLKSENFSLNAGIGSGQIITANGLTQTIGGSSEEVIANPFPFLNPNSKVIRATFGKIVLETIDALVSGGIDLNVGPLGVAGKIAIKAPLGDIDIKSNTGPAGINIQATTIAKLKGLVQAAVEGALVNIKADALCSIDGALITVGGQTEPMILGKTFLMDIFKDHQHPSSTGPTGPIMPQYAAKILQAMSKKCFLG